MNSSWAPPGESAADLWLEKSNFHGGTLAFIAYGVHLTLYGTVLQHLIQNLKAKKGNYYFIAYITWNFILGSLGIAGEAWFNQKTFVDDRNFPGGPNGFVYAQYSDPINVFGVASYIVLNWFADGLVLSRLWLIYGYDYRVAGIPTAMLVASIATSCILLAQLSRPGANLWTSETVSIGVPYGSISTALNVLVTLLIVGRLMWVRRRTRRALAASHARTYTSVAAMLTESAALYTLFALGFIICYIQNSNVQNLFFPTLGQVQAISPLLIMSRVARGQAWTRETVAATSKISWAPPPSRTRSQRTTEFGITFTRETRTDLSPPAPILMHKESSSTVSQSITFDEPGFVAGRGSPESDLDISSKFGKEQGMDEFGGAV